MAQRQPHAVQDAPSRRLKALKIERLLDLGRPLHPLRMLEIGCGIGGIAHYFGTHPEIQFEVDAVDTVDLRQFRDGYRFALVTGTQLPFTDAIFDIVITNHVIEHVGDRKSQAEHLGEIRRVMKPNGCGYLAVPNRWQLVEPHYQLAFLSWLPRSLRSPYLRRMRGVEFYDCEPLAVHELETLLGDARFSFSNASVRAAHLMFEIEHPDSSAVRLLRWVPEPVLESLKRVIPTLIYLLRPA